MILETPINKYNGTLAHIAELKLASCDSFSCESRDALLETLSIHLHDLHLRLLGLHSGLDSLPLFRRGVRLAEVLLDAMRETSSAELSSYRWGDRITNSTQQLYSVLNSVAYDLSSRIWTVEAANPKQQSDFRAERTKYIMSYEQSKSLDQFEYNGTEGRGL